MVEWGGLCGGRGWVERWKGVVYVVERVVCVVERMVCVVEVCCCKTKY